MTSSRFGCNDGLTLAARMRDRRAEARRRTARRVQVVHDGEAAHARCRDLSDTGMKLDLTTPLDLNDCVTVALSPSIVLCGTVTWINGRECGIAFDCPVDSAALLDAVEPVAHAPGTLAMLDALGARQMPATAPAPRSAARRSPSGFQPGLSVTVMVGPNREERGVVRWANGDVVALELERIEVGERPAQALLPAPK